MKPENKTNSLIVQKYGGATLSTPEKIKAVAKRIFDLHTSGVKIVVVVSAMGETTNQLIQLASEVSNRPQLRELDMLLTVGERISMSLLSMALNDLGCAAISFTGSQAGIITDDSHVNANIIEVKAYRVEEALKENKVVILAGFQGVSKNTKEITTLGRGGSDITAVAMAAYLNADRCEILKDVNGIYSADPKIVTNAKLISLLNYEQLLAMTFWGAKVLHFSSVKLASEKNVTLYVGPAIHQNQNSGTLVTAAPITDINMALSINSFSTVLTIETKKSFDEFQMYLQKNQIGWCSLLHEVNNTKFITASNEVLNAIIHFEKNQNEFEIKKNDLSVVTITYKKEITDVMLNTCNNILEKNKITPYQTLKTKNSLHFFISSNQKNEATQILHQFTK